MRRTRLDRLCEAYGLQLSYRGTSNRIHVASDPVKRAILEAMSVAAEDDAAVTTSLAEAPAPTDAAILAPTGVRCYMPDSLADGRAWGVTCQLYGLRSARNHGIGDFEDLACLAERVADAGGDFLGVNPLHALFTADPARCSPFSPSNRSFLNPLYITLDRVPGAPVPTGIDDKQLATLRSAQQVDYRDVAACKFGALRRLWRRLSDEPDLWTDATRDDFDAFVDAGGEALHSYALFETLSHLMVADGYGAGWHGWPDAYRDIDSAAVRQAAATHGDDIRFHQWLQWIADHQLRDAAGRARRAGMRIGLYLDFAVGTAPDGSATWTDPQLVVSGANIGAPPDAFFADGQDWGLAPLSPAVLRQRGFSGFRDILNRATRHAGAVRIDHVMGLHRLFWIPHGMAATDGCYVIYPLADMLRTLADVSQAQQTIVIGEDLGTVPPGFREMMQAVGMLSYSLLFFERTRRGFRPARSYRRNAFVSASTHDLPPLAAWWAGSDVELFRKIGLFDADAADRRRDERVRDRRELMTRLCRDLPKSALTGIACSRDGAAPAMLSPELAVAIHSFLARTPSFLLAVQFEDLCAANVPVNIPGTSDQYPNWRMRAPMTIDDATAGRLWSAILHAVANARPKCA